MRCNKTWALVLAVPVVAAALWGCGDSSAEAGPEAGSKAQPERAGTRAETDAEAATVRAEPPPPDDYVRSRCMACSCRVFTGSAGLCARPSCHHSWKDHRSQLAKD